MCKPKTKRAEAASTQVFMLNALEQNWALEASWWQDVLGIWYYSLSLVAKPLPSSNPFVLLQVPGLSLSPRPHSACKSGSLSRTQSTQLPDACSFQRPFGVLKGNLTTARTVQAVNGKARRGLWRELWPLLRVTVSPPASLSEPTIFPYSLQLSSIPP